MVHVLQSEREKKKEIKDTIYKLSVSHTKYRNLRHSVAKRQKQKFQFLKFLVRVIYLHVEDVLKRVSFEP